MECVGRGAEGKEKGLGEGQKTAGTRGRDMREAQWECQEAAPGVSHQL